MLYFFAMNTVGYMEIMEIFYDIEYIVVRCIENNQGYMKYIMYLYNSCNRMGNLNMNVNGYRNTFVLDMQLAEDIYHGSLSLQRLNKYNICYYEVYNQLDIFKHIHLNAQKNHRDISRI